MNLLLSMGAFALINLLGAISPGPDFLVVTKNSISHSRTIGVCTALGVGAGILVHVTYTVVGIGLIISKSIVLFSLIKFLGALYLMYLGARLLLNGAATTSNGGSGVPDQVAVKSNLEALREGFLTNALNPKASVFFVSLFSQFFSPATPMLVQATYGLEAALVVGVWFVLLSTMLTHPTIRSRIERVQGPLMKVMGAALIALGIKVAVSQR